MEKLMVNGVEVKLTKNKSSRGWDAADEYLLSELEDVKGRTLIIDDKFGALTCGINGDVVTYCSSYNDEVSIKESLYLNGKDIKIVNNFDDLPVGITTVVIRLPKYIDLLEYYLQIIGTKLPGVKVVVGGMVKYMPITMVRLMEKYFQDVKTSLAKKKARLIYGTSSFNNNNPKSFPLTYKIEGDLEVCSYPGVFSSDHLDIGTRFLMQHTPSGRQGTIIDLGCASGVIGLNAKKQNPEANVVLTDESYLAVKSARESFERNGLEGTFHVMDVLKGYESDSADIILCNPPFHQGNIVLTDIAIQMFKQSRRVLRRGGTLFIVANKHLGYHKKLRAIYHNLTKVAENEKFFIYTVRKV